MAKQKSETHNWLQSNLIRLSRVHYFYVLAHAVAIVIFDSWNLIPPEALAQRWTMTAVLMAVTTIVWFVARFRVPGNIYYASLFAALVLVDIAVAGVSVYTQRGMASRAVILFAVPIAIAAITHRWRAVVAAAALSVAAYAYAAIRYFIENPSEGYKVELYGEVAFYSSLFFVLAAILSLVIHTRRA